MAVTVTERNISRSGDGNRIVLIYTVVGTADDSAARDALLSEAPASHDGLSRDTARPHVERIYVDTENPAGSAWLGKVTYRASRYSRHETGDDVYSFEIGTTTDHVTYALETVRAYGTFVNADGSTSSASVDDFGGLIGVDLLNQRVEGLDILVPVYRWSERHYVNDSVVTTTYKKLLYNLTAKINQSTWRGFEPGEVMFLGARGSYREDDDDWEITFSFAASPNYDSLTVGQGAYALTGVQKRGWEAVDLQSWPNSAGVVVPRAAYVQKVYRYGDFSDLGI